MNSNKSHSLNRKAKTLFGVTIKLIASLPYGFDIATIIIRA